MYSNELSDLDNISNELLIKCLPPQLLAKRAWVCLLMQIIAILVKSNLSGDPVPKQL